MVPLSMNRLVICDKTRAYTTNTAPASCRTAQFHTARHIGVLTILSTHSSGVTMRNTAITTVIRAVAANMIFTTATRKSSVLGIRRRGHTETHLPSMQGPLSQRKASRLVRWSRLLEVNSETVLPVDGTGGAFAGF